MNPIADLARRILRLENDKLKLNTGVVTDISPFTVSVGGGEDVVGIAAVAGLTYAVDDVVLVLTTKDTQTVIGVLGDGS